MAAVIAGVVTVFGGLFAISATWLFNQLGKIEENRRQDVRDLHKSIGGVKDFTAELMREHNIENRAFRDSVNKSIGGLKALVTGKVNGDD